uniref:Uncharacterized protein n=1 Tax=Populus alba TaxID=43335 RepID=A0A4U5QZ62_POPAL|nr:hypothetical protein D5086_0000026840 [Populus alba]
MALTISKHGEPSGKIFAGGVQTLHGFAGGVQTFVASFVSGFRECCTGLGLADLNSTASPGAFSDHSRASVQFGPQQPRGNRNFKFFNMKLECLKRPLKELNKLHFSHISERVTRPEADLATLQSLLYHNQDNTQLLSRERNLRSSLLNLKYTEQMFFGQKLKSNFLKEAEKGSHFFHSLMSQKHRRNHIPADKESDSIP